MPFGGIIRILCSLFPGHAAFMYFIYLFICFCREGTDSNVDGKVGYRTPPEDVFSKQPWILCLQYVYYCGYPEVADGVH